MTSFNICPPNISAAFSKEGSTNICYRRKLTHFKYQSGLETLIQVCPEEELQRKHPSVLLVQRFPVHITLDPISFVSEFYTVQHICNPSALAFMRTINQPRMSSTTESETFSDLPTLVRCHQWNQSSLWPTLSCWGVLLQFTLRRQTIRRWAGCCAQEIHFPSPGHMAQKEGNGGPAELPFKQTGLVSLPCWPLWLQQYNCSSGICLQVTPASCPYPGTRRRACLRLQINPFIFTKILGPNMLFNNLRMNYTSSWSHQDVQARHPWNRKLYIMEINFSPCFGAEE